ncbi:hypothetical protein B0T21DRAFT_450539 [Apiosordaria backusii]|uniref:Uncharacterized protein n=1 Tax=Apiosordaria backusii TaxID=314023 RepID=A0AA40EGZ3_9PEZI|nr:hypothetical protein B0T21DRAFT_450539 [Apiosordaria backusii]
MANNTTEDVATNTTVTTGTDINVRFANADNAEDVDAIYELNLQQHLNSPLWNHVFPDLSNKGTGHPYYKLFQTLVKEHIKYSAQDPRSFYLVAEASNSSTSKPEILASACFEWITNHHKNKKASRYQIAEDRAIKVNFTSTSSILGSHLEPKDASRIRQFIKYFAIDQFSTITDFFITYHFHPSQPQIPKLPTTTQERLSDIVQHYKALQEEVLDLVFRPEKPKSVNHPKTYPGLWYCHNLTHTRSASVPDPLKSSSIIHLLAWMEDAVDLYLCSPGNNIPPGPDIICVPLPNSRWSVRQSFWEPHYSKLATEKIPVVPAQAPTGLFDSLRQKLGSSSRSSTSKEKEKVIEYSTYLRRTDGRVREDPQRCLYKPGRREYAERFYKEKWGRERKEADEAREEYFKRQEELEKQKEKERDEEGEEAVAGGGGSSSSASSGSTRARTGGFQGASGFSKGVSIFGV